MGKNNSQRKGNPTHDLFRFYWNNSISRPRLLNHARAHRAYVFSHNGTGLYTIYLVLLDAEISAFSNSISGKMSDIGSQLSGTVLTNASVKAFSDKVHEQYPNIVYIFRANPEIVLQFYPHGLSEFDHIAMENAQVLMNFFNAAVALHHTSFDAGVVAWFASQATNFGLVRAGQQGEMGDVSDDIITIIAAKKALIAALIAGHGIVAYNNSSDETAALGFWNYSLLYRSRDVAHVKVAGTTHFDSSSLAKEILLDEFDWITAKNTSLVSRIGVWASATGTDAPTSTTKIKWLDAGLSGGTAPQDIDATTKHYIMICVDNLTDDGTWELDFHDA